LIEVGTPSKPYIINNSLKQWVGEVWMDVVLASGADKPGWTHNRGIKTPNKF
jgi:hypothetical protein